MILLDSSALICAIREEPGAERLRAIMRESKLVAVGSPIVVEAGMVLSRDVAAGRFALEGFLGSCQAEYLEFRKEHSAIALSAFERFGKGRHPASLNFGDCMSYALARASGLTLVYKGLDFGQTDLERLVRLD
jgi:ribonuclease VapC